MSHAAAIAVWAISAATIASILLRPARIGEWVFAVAGAAVLVVSGLVSGADAARAAVDGVDVYLFLAGMLGLAELASIHGVFDWLAARLLPKAGGSTGRVFAAVYGAGIVVTAFLSNDGTIVLVTPAVLAITRQAKIRAMPCLFACAFVANAASFVLPVSNPANLVVFKTIPTIGPWIETFAVPSVIAIACTYILLRYAFRADLRSEFRVPANERVSPLGPPGRAALIAVTASAMLVAIAASLGQSIGLSAFFLAIVSVLVVAAIDRNTPRLIVTGTPWSIVPLVCGLFVMVQALDRSGVLEIARRFFRYAGALPHVSGNLLTGFAVTIADNILNNLPAGVMARYSLQGHGIDPHLAAPVLVAVDVGPNFSLTGSLATMLWLIMLRRSGIEVQPYRFLRVGTIVTLPTLALALLFAR